METDAGLLIPFFDFQIKFFFLEKMREKQRKAAEKKAADEAAAAQQQCKIVKKDPLTMKEQDEKLFWEYCKKEVMMEK